MGDADLIGRTDDWWAGYRAGCEASHSHVCDAVQDERDMLAELTAKQRRDAAQRIADLQAEYGRHIAALERRLDGRDLPDGTQHQWGWQLGAIIDVSRDEEAARHEVSRFPAVRVLVRRVVGPWEQQPTAVPSPAEGDETRG